MAVRHHAAHVQVLDADGMEPARDLCGEFVQGIEADVGEAGAAARRVLRNQPARRLPAAQRRDGHAKRSRSFTYAHQSPHFGDISIGMDRFNLICSHPIGIKSI